MRLGTAPAIEGREIVDAEALIDQSGRALRFVEGISAPTLARLAEECEDIGRLCAAYNARSSRAELGAVLRALATLVASGLLRERPPAG